MEHLYIALIALIGFVILVAAALLVPKVREWLATKVSQIELDEIIKVTTKLVECAEQTLKAKTGAEKKAYVMSCLTSFGYEITEEILAYIESAVFEMNKEAKE